MVDKSKIKTVGKNALGTFIIPILFIVVLNLICVFANKTLISSSTEWNIFIISTASITITTIALSINLNSGRFDFSLGSMATLSSIIASKITYSLLNGGSFSPIMFLLLSIIVSALLGLIAGGVYVLLRIPPIITSLAMTLVYEGLAFTITKGKYVMEEVQVPSIMSFMKQWWAIALILLLVLAIIIYVFDHTNFGYKYKSLKEGQKLSVSQGIKEIPNALICYTICGGLMGIVGFLQAGLTTNINGGSLNFGSIGIMFTAFLPMFIGGYIGRYSNDKFGYFLAGLSMALLNSFFSTFHNEIDASVQSIITAVLLVLFLIYLSNEYKIVLFLNKLKNKSSQKKTAE